MVKDPQIKLAVSTATFGEIAAALEQQGFKLGVNVAEIVLAKGTELKQPVDFRLATIRKDCALIASRIYAAKDTVGFIDFVDQVYQYVLNGKEANLPTAANLVDKINKWK